MDKTVMGNDAAALRSLVGMLNDPRITGAELPAAGAAPTPTEHFDGGESTLPPEVIPTGPAQSAAVVRPTPPPTPAPAARKHSIGLRLLFTGRNLESIISGIPATEFGILAPVTKLAETFFSGTVFNEVARINTPGANSFVNTLRAWGAGEITETYPITEIRACFVTMIRSLAATGYLDKTIDWNRFGSDGGFWIDIAVNSAKRFQEAHPNQRFIVTGVTTKEEFQHFRALGLTHWHIMARPGVGISDGLSVSMDNDVTKQISVARVGAKLRCIWNDATPPASGRLWTAHEFKQAAL